MPRGLLGELEHLILLAIVRCDRAYGAAIIAEIESRTGRDVAHAAVYIALQRLEAKGLVKSTQASGTTERGGRARVTFALTPHGKARLHESGQALFRMWEGISVPIRGRS